MSSGRRKRAGGGGGGGAEGLQYPALVDRAVATLTKVRAGGQDEYRLERPLASSAARAERDCASVPLIFSGVFVPVVLLSHFICARVCVGGSLSPCLVAVVLMLLITNAVAAGCCPVVVVVVVRNGVHDYCS